MKMSVSKVDSAYVNSREGAPLLLVDGKPTAPLWYALSDIPAAKAWKECSQRAIRNFSIQGIDIVCVDTDLYKGWNESGEYDPETLFGDIRAVLTANPNARIVTRLHLNPPYWWLRKHREELVGYVKKEFVDGVWQYSAPKLTDSGEYGDRTIARKHLPYEMRASIGSSVWINDTCNVLKQLCEKVKAHPLGRSLIGIQIAYGHCGEWHMWSDSDYGQAMQGAFRRMLKDEYTSEQLRRYYGENVNVDSVKMATKKEVDDAFSEVGDGVLSMDRYALIVDTLRVFSYASAEAIRSICRCIKEAWGEILAGAFYGYFFSTGGADAAHSEVERIYKDKNVDFLAAPCAYGDNKRSGNMNMLRYVAESCRINGKLMLCEMDQGYRSVNRASADGAYVCESESEYSAIMKRNVVENLLLGCGAWFYDHRFVPSSIYEKEEYWATPERLDTVGQIVDFGKRTLARQYRKTTDVLLVVDAGYCYRTKTVSTGFEFINALGKSGAGFDRLFLTDTDICDVSGYKCVIFADCVTLGDVRYRPLAERIRANGTSVVLIGATDRSFFADDSSVYMRTPVTDPSYWKELFRSCGAHIYTEGGEVTVADNGMVMVHCKDIPETLLHLPCGDVRIKNERFSTVVYDCQSGQRLL